MGGGRPGLLPGSGLADIVDGASALPARCFLIGFIYSKPAKFSRRLRHFAGIGFQNPGHERFLAGETEDLFQNLPRRNARLALMA